jgi:hypothetical protein
MANYPINFDWTFILFWGFFLAVSLVWRGPLFFASIALMILILVSHEHAHLVECEKRGVPVEFVKFNMFGGLISNPPNPFHANDGIPILVAGVLDTACYAVAFGELLIIATMYGVGYPWDNLLWSAFLFSLVMAISNVFPGTYNSKKYGPIKTDGYAAFQMLELRSEMWNDGKEMAVGIP